MVDVDIEVTVNENNSYGKKNGRRTMSFTNEEPRTSGCSEDNVRKENGYLR